MPSASVCFKMAVDRRLTHDGTGVPHSGLKRGRGDSIQSSCFNSILVNMLIDALVVNIVAMVIYVKKPPRQFRNI